MTLFLAFWGIFLSCTLLAVVKPHDYKRGTSGPTNGHPHCRSSTGERDAMKSRIARLEKQQSVADRFRRPLDLQAKRVKAELKETAQVQ